MINKTIIDLLECVIWFLLMLIMILAFSGCSYSERHWINYKNKKILCDVVYSAMYYRTGRINLENCNDKTEHINVTDITIIDWQMKGGK